MQGIQGQVRYRQGNHLPQGGQGLNPRSAAGWRSAIPAISSIKTVWIFAGRIAARGVRWAVAEVQQYPGWVQQVTTDATGRFMVTLVPGDYTVFAQDGEDLYLNCFTGHGEYAWTPVRAGEMTTVDLVNSSAAVF